MDMGDDEWVRVAMDDDKLVVDLLLKLNQPVVVGPAPARPPPQPRRKLEALRLDWSVRQPRSSSNKQQQQLPRSKRTVAKKEASPTTPLSWSGGGGATSSAADGFEESSSRPRATRSEVVFASEMQTTKRSRKKKTLAELREEERSLLTERRDLKNQLADLQLILEKERARNESFKRIKLQLDSLSRQMSEAVTVAVKSEEANSDQQPQKIQAEPDPTCSISPTSAACSKLEQSLPETASHSEDIGGGHSSFFLPDLNLPVDEDSGSNVLYGTS